MVNSYIAIDLETTGLNPRLEKITEIGAVKVADGIIIDTYSALVNPRKQLCEQISALTGITDEMLRDARDIEEVILEAVEFCEDYPLLGHQISFDFSFLKRAAVNQGIRFEKMGIDTLTLARRFMPAEEKKNLSYACRYFGINQTREHRAFYDACSAHYLYQGMAKRYGEEAPEAFAAKILNYKAKKEQPATKRQKDYLRELTKYHKISLTVQIDYLSRNEASRMTDKIISEHGRMVKVNQIC